MDPVADSTVHYYFIISIFCNSVYGMMHDPQLDGQSFTKSVIKKHDYIEMEREYELSCRWTRVTGY